MSEQNGQQSWRDRLFGASNNTDQPEAEQQLAEPKPEQPVTEPEVVEEDSLTSEQPAVVDEVTDEDLAQAEAEQAKAAPADAPEDDDRLAWEAAFNGEEKEPTAEYRPSPSTPAPDAEVEPQMVQPSTLRGPNPTGEMHAVEAEPEASPELVEPARPQLSLRRRERAIADAREAEAALADDPASEEPVETEAEAAPTQAMPVYAQQSEQQEPLPHVDEPERPAETVETEQPAEPAEAAGPEQQTRVLDEPEHRPAEDERATTALPVAGAAAAGGAAAGAATAGDADARASDRDVDDIMFVEQPEQPRKRGARGVGFVVVLLSTIVFGGLFGLALVGADYLFNTAFDAGMLLTVWLSSEWIFPVVAFFLAYWLLTLIVNRAGWWAHVLGGFIVALITYAAYIFATNFEHNGGWADLGNFFAFTRDGVVPALLSAGAVFAFVLAREVPIWLGGIVSKRGRKQRERYNAELEEYHRQTAAAEDE